MTFPWWITVPMIVSYFWPLSLLGITLFVTLAVKLKATWLRAGCAIAAVVISLPVIFLPPWSFGWTCCFLN